jgi:predicted secreted protein
MAITSAIVLFAVIWFMTLFIVLPQRFESQGEAGKVEPGTPASAPSDAQMKRKFWITTLIALPIWVVVVAVILSGVITVDDIDMFTRIGR